MLYKKEMKQFKIIPLSAVYAAEIRTKRKDNFGHAVIEQLATRPRPLQGFAETF